MRRPGLVALAVYAGLGLAFFGIPILPRLRTAFVGSVVGHDVAAYIWFLAWWPYAIVHGLDPFRPEIVWAPTGYNLAWSASVPGLALLMAPVTLAWGPVASYNLASLLSPVVSAWAGFLLCRHVAKAFWPAVIGGYVYGFSTYVVAHLQGHLNMAPAFVAPLAVYVVLLRLEERLSRRWFVGLLAALLVFQFTLFTEVFATLTIFGGLALVLGVAMLRDARAALWRLIPELAAAYVVAGVLLLPYLYYLFAFGFPREQIHEMEPYSIDLLNFAIPTPVSLFHRPFFDVAKAFTGNWSESVGYVGLPLIAIAFLFGRWRGGTPVGRWALVLLGLICLLSLGPNLHIAGIRTVPMPWALAVHLPLINHAATGRFMMYASLVLAVIAAVWLAGGPPRAWLRASLAVLALACLLPNVWYWPFRSAWFAELDVPPFFSTGTYRQHLAPGQNTLIIPFSERGNSSLWQAWTGMYFRMAGGYVGVAAREFLRWPIVYTFYGGGVMPNHGPQLRAFLEAHDVKTVIVADGAEGPWPALMGTLGVDPVRTGGVTLYPMPGARANRVISRVESDRDAALAQVAALVVAADDWHHAGLPHQLLVPEHVRGRGLVPAYWGVYPDSRSYRKRMLHLQTREGLWIGPWEGGTTSIGVSGSSAALGPVAARYGRHAARVLFPYPSEVTGRTLPDGTGFLVMIFSREGLLAARAETTRILGP